MKKSKILLLGALVSMLSVGCEKEQSVTDSINPVFKTQNQQALRISYRIGNSTPYYVVVSSYSELSALLDNLLVKIYQGEHVFMGNEGTVSINAVAEDIIRIETKDPEEFKKWCADMLQKEYYIQMYYDKEKSLYVGFAIKK